MAVRSFLKCNFPINPQVSLLVGWLVGRLVDQLVGLSVGRSVFHNSLKKADKLYLHVPMESLLLLVMS